MPSKDELVQRYNRMNTIPQVMGQGTAGQDGNGDMAPTGAGDRVVTLAAVPTDPLHPVPLPPEPQPELHRALRRCGDMGM